MTLGDTTLPRSTYSWHSETQLRRVNNIAATDKSHTHDSSHSVGASPGNDSASNDITISLKSDIQRFHLERWHRAHLHVLPWTIPHVLALKEHVYLTERRPLSLVPIPTFAHQIKDLLRAVTWLCWTHLLVVMAIVMAAVLDDAIVRHRLERLLPSEGQNLPQGDGERPNVALGREPALKHMICLPTRRSTSINNLSRLQICVNCQ